MITTYVSEQEAREALSLDTAEILLVRDQGVLRATGPGAPNGPLGLVPLAALKAVLARTRGPDGMQAAMEKVVGGDFQ